MVFMSKVADALYFLVAIACGLMVWHNIIHIELAIKDIIWIISN
jgi:hypothetical protein